MVFLSIRDYIKYKRKHGFINANTETRLNDAVDSLQIEQVNTDDINSIWLALRKRMEDKNTYADVRLMRDNLVLPLLKRNGVAFVRGVEYSDLNDLLKQRVKQISKVPYSDEQIKILLAAVDRANDYGLYRLIILLTYSGIRIQSASNVKVSKMTLLPEGVYAFVVTSKKHTYTAFLSPIAYNRIEQVSGGTMDYITNHRADTYKSSFSNYCRAKLAYAIISAGVQDSVTKGTSIMHSFRKNFASRIANDGLANEDVSLLLGHIPNTLAYKAYITMAGRKTEHIVSRSAKAYAKTSLMNLEVWK